MLSSSILKIFAHSPIKPMQQHMEKVFGCVNELKPFFENVIKQNWDKAKKNHKQIMQLEEEADNLKREIRLHMPNSLFLPVARADLLELLTQQDKIANKAKHISGLVYGRNMVIFPVIENNFKSFLQRGIDAIALANKAINELDDLVEAGFKGREVKIVEKMILELEQVERDTDNMQVDLRQQLFTIEKTLDPIDVIFFYKIIDWTAELADRAQTVGQRLESLLASR